MSDKFVLDAESRDVVGKKVKQLRRDGLVPAVIYGLGEPENVQLNALKATLALRDASSTEIFTLNLGGKQRRVIARDVQRHVVRRDLIHVDFQEVDENSTIRDKNRRPNYSRNWQKRFITIFENQIVGTSESKSKWHINWRTGQKKFKNFYMLRDFDESTKIFKGYSSFLLFCLQHLSLRPIQSSFHSICFW